MLLLAFALSASTHQQELKRAYADALTGVYVMSICSSDLSIVGRLRSRIELAKTRATERGYADTIDRAEAMFQGDLAKSNYLCLANSSQSAADAARQSVEGLEAAVTNIPVHNR